MALIQLIGADTCMYTQSVVNGRLSSFHRFYSDHKAARSLFTIRVLLDRRYRFARPDEDVPGSAALPIAGKHLVELERVETLTRDPLSHLFQLACRKESLSHQPRLQHSGRC